MSTPPTLQRGMVDFTFTLLYRCVCVWLAGWCEDVCNGRPVHIHFSQCWWTRHLCLL